MTSDEQKLTKKLLIKSLTTFFKVRPLV